MLTIRFARGSGSVLWGHIGREFCYRSGQRMIGVSRFIMLRRGASRGALRVVIHWTEELQRMLDSGGR